MKLAVTYDELIPCECVGGGRPPPQRTSRSNTATQLIWMLVPVVVLAFNSHNKSVVTGQHSGVEEYPREKIQTIRLS